MKNIITQRSQRRRERINFFLPFASFVSFAPLREELQDNRAEGADASRLCVRSSSNISKEIKNIFPFLQAKCKFEITARLQVLKFRSVLFVKIH